MHFREKLVRFMYGRYGIDQLYYGLLLFYIVLFLAEFVFDTNVLPIISSIVVLYTFWRVFSKNIPARKKENDVFLRLYRPVKQELVLLKDRIRDHKTCRYRHCKHCSAILKLPRKLGKHTVVCPKCSERFHVRILF